MSSATLYRKGAAQPLQGLQIKCSIENKGGTPLTSTRRFPQRGDGRGENGTAPSKTGTGYERKDPYKAAPRCWAAAPQTTPEGRSP